MTTPAPSLDKTGTAGDPLLSVRDLKVAFGSEHGVVNAVRGVSFDLHPGTTLAIAGESGSGKSVTSQAIMGLLPDTAAISGSVTLHGRELIGMSDKQMSTIRGKQLAMVFQDPISSLTPVFSVGQQIIEALDVHQDLTRAQARTRAAELLDLVGIPEPEKRLNTFPHEFSGGMRQRVMIAMAIANDPDVIIADEPTTALDVTVQAQVLEVLKAAQRETGAATLLITHDLGVVAGMGDDVLVMYAGRPVERGAVDEVFYRTQMPYTMGLLAAVPRPDRTHAGPLVPIVGSPPALVSLPPGCPFAPRCPMAIDACRDAEPPLTAHGPGTGGDTDTDGELVAGHVAACIRADEIIDQELTSTDVYPVPELAESDLEEIPRDQRDTVLAVEDLHKHFTLTSGITRRRIGVVRAVDGISFDIKKGETLALVGESGCGKSTTLMELMALLPPKDGGKVVVMGQDVAGLRGAKARRQLRSGLQIVFQDPQASMDPRMPVYDVIAEPMKVQGRSKKQINERISELMELVGLNPDHVDRFAEQFSGGQRQRICIARALAVEPELIVLDEPVASLDVSIQAGVINLLDDLQARLGVSFLFVSHDLSVVRHIADRVAVMYLGRLMEVGDTDHVFDTPKHPYTHALLSAAPVPDPEIERGRERIILTGDLPSPSESITGCRFRSRCPKYQILGEADQHKCQTEEPVLTGEGVADQQRACHFPM